MNYCQFRNLTIKRMATAGGATPILPPEYQQVELLQSSGTQHIDTGIASSDNLQLTARAAKDNTGYGSTANAIFGQRYGSGSYLFVSLSNGNVAAGYRSYGTVTTQTVNTDTAYTYDAIYDNGTITVKVDDNVIINSTASGTLSLILNVYLFCLHSGYNNATTNYFRGMIYSCKISEYNNGNPNLLRDFIPCYRKSDNKPGMYDLVTNTFFTNAGTGEFTVGNNV